MTKVMVCGGITKDVMSKSMVDPCGVCSFGAKANLVLCLLFGKQIHSICAGVKRLMSKFYEKLTCRSCAGNIGEEYWRQWSRK